jgi:hypothetical protein
MTSLEALRVGWMALSEKPTKDGRVVSTIPLELETPAGQVLVGRDLEGGRHLLVPSPLELVVSDDASEAVRIQPLELGTGADRESFVDVVCEEEALFDVFDDLLVVLTREVSQAQDPGGVCAEVVFRWREMLRPARQESLSVSQAAGLLAELITAIRIVELDPQSRIDVWQGPSGAKHDFRRGRDAIEVKASLSHKEASALIHGLEQLEAPDQGSLHLVWMRMEQIADGSLSVDQKVQELRSLVSGTEVMYRLLGEAGWSPGAESAKLTFEVVESRVFSVDRDFPKLTASSLSQGVQPPGIDDVRYRVLLDAVQPLDEAAVSAMLSVIAEGH